MIRKLMCAAAVGVGVFAPAGFVVATVDDTEPDTTEGSIDITDTGDPAHQVVVNPEMSVGGTRVTETASAVGTVEFTGDEAFSTPIDVTTETVRAVDVTALEDDGYVAEVTVESYELTIAEGGDLAESFAFGDEWGSLDGLTFDATYSSDRELVSLTPQSGTEVTTEQQEAVDELSEDSGAAGLPTEPLGVGATWTADMPLFGTEGAASFELISLEGDAWTVEYEYATDAETLDNMDLPEGFESASGAVTVSGTMTGDATNPFAGTVELAMDFALTYSSPQGELIVDLDMTSQQTLEPA